MSKAVWVTKATEKRRHTILERGKETKEKIKIRNTLPILTAGRKHELKKRRYPN